MFVNIIACCFQNSTMNGRTFPHIHRLMKKPDIDFRIGSLKLLNNS